MSAEIRVQVHLFARLRELCGGRPSVTLQLPGPADAAACFELLVAEFPDLAGQQPSLVVAVNEEYGTWETALADGDEVTFIPPVSGG